VQLLQIYPWAVLFYDTLESFWEKNVGETYIQLQGCLLASSISWQNIPEFCTIIIKSGRKSIFSQ
jgi:hypothetical protein